MNLKLENSKFFENLDFLNDEYAENFEKNKFMKENIKNIEKSIETYMKEKTNAKALFCALYPGEMALVDEVNSYSSKMLDESYMTKK